MRSITATSRQAVSTRNQMQINLPTEQERWLQVQVSSGAFSSIEAAIQQLIAAEMSAENFDPTWARELDEARQSVARGEGISMKQAIKNMHEHVAKLRSS